MVHSYSNHFDTHIYTSDQSGLFPSVLPLIMVKCVNKTLAKDVSDNIKLTFDVRTEKVTVHL